MAIPLVGAVAAILAIPFVGPLVAPLNRSVSHFANRKMPNEILPLDILFNMRRRGHITNEEYITEISNLGYNESKGDLLQTYTNVLLNAQDYVVLKRKGKITIEEYLESMDKIGFTKEQAELLDTVVEPIPSVGDIIQFAVREVYSPEIAKENRQYEGGKEVFDIAKPDIEAQGLSYDNFMKYWAAHWQLPSIGQGYEMLQRDMITHEQLDRLFVALDIMPGYVAPLKGISYSPFTRVDIRRMHKFGVLSEEDVFVAYAHNGFNPNVDGHLHENSNDAYACFECRTRSDVGRMTAFTVAYNSDPIEEETTESDKRVRKEKELTKADILKGLRYRIISEDMAKTALYEAGYSEFESEYLVGIETYKIEEDKFDANLEAIHKSYVKGVLDKNETLAMLGPMNIAGALQEELFEQWDIEKIPKLQQPSRADILKFLKKGVIDKPTATEELEKLGYNDKYIGWYLSDSQPSEDEE